MNQNELSIIKTLAYADVFDYPLSAQQLYKFLEAPGRVGEGEFFQSLDKLIKLDHIKTYSNNYQVIANDIVWYYLAGREEVCQKRLSRIKFSQAKYEKTRRTAKALWKIPQVQALLVTGSLAVCNAQSDDDIDILVVTKAGSLWQTRLLVTAVLEYLQVRRKPEDAHRGRASANKICANMYLSEDKLQVLPSKRNLYTAHELVQARPIFDKAHILPRLYRENAWVTTLLPHGLDASNSHKDHKIVRHPAVLAGVLESISYNLQKWYMRPKVTTEIIQPDRAQFHPRDTASWVLDQYQLRLSKYLK